VYLQNCFNNGLLGKKELKEVNWMEGTTVND